jgi:hypothetical protein
MGLINAGQGMPKLISASCNNTNNLSRLGHKIVVQIVSENIPPLSISARSVLDKETVVIHQNV